MKTADDVILEIKELSHEEQQKVIEFVAAMQDETFYAVDGSEVSEEWLLEEAKLCKQGMDSETHASADEYCKAHEIS